MSINLILKNIRDEFNRAINGAIFNKNKYANGNKAKEALIRSQKIIHYLHEFIKKEFAKNGVPKRMIYPPIGKSSPEVKIRGFLKSKNQDVSIITDAKLVPKTKTLSSDNEKILTVKAHRERVWAKR